VPPPASHKIHNFQSEPPKPVPENVAVDLATAHPTGARLDSPPPSAGLSAIRNIEERPGFAGA